MNMNEQLNQLGQVGSVGYNPKDAVVDQLIGRAKRARAIRQGSAALVGSIGAIGLGLLGAQVFVNITADNDPGTMADRGFDFNSMEWGDRYGEDYTGLGKTQDEVAEAWEDLKAAAAVKTDEPAPVKTDVPATCEYSEKNKDGWVYYKSTSTGCDWVKKERIEIDIPDGSFLFGNGQIYKCEQWTDAATGTSFWGAWSGTGDWGYKMIQCDPNDKYEYSYKYLGSSATITGHTCTGVQVNYLGAPHRISCRTTGALAGIYGDWNGANGGNIAWSLNNNDGKILLSPSTYKWFVSGTCSSNLYSNSTPLFGFPGCHEVACDGWYYTTSQHPEKNGDRYSWSGSSWVVDNPTPTPTETTPPPEPSVTPDPEPSL